jgi:hypothetical protein
MCHNYADMNGIHLRVGKTALKTKHLKTFCSVIEMMTLLYGNHNSCLTAALHARTMVEMQISLWQLD